MRNLKPSDAAMRRERFVSELSAAPAPSPSLGARIEEISGFESVPPPRSSKPTSGRRASSGIALIAGSVALLTIVLCVALLPRALG